ncbi:MAG: ABC transporter permease [Candidatus Pacearchaeota archaeon]|nr:ABC transporter permease [Candidatus Pacearchaeota archaeon]
MNSPIYIMWLRQIKRYWRSKARMIGSLAQPLLFLVALGFGFGPIFQKAGGGNYIDFLAPGIIAMSILFTAMFNGIEVIWDREFGFLKETLVAPVPRYKIMIGRTLGGATVAALQGLVVLIISFAIGFRVNNILMIPVAFVLMFLLAMLFTAFGTAVASKLGDMQAFPLIMNFITMPLFFLSGALFPISGLPPALDIVTRINPLSYGVDGIRGALTGLSHLGLYTDFGVIIVLTLIVGMIGSYLFSKIEI